MVTHIVLIDFTSKGIEQIKSSPHRAAGFIESASGSGVKVEGAYWTAGSHDGVLLLNAPDDESAAALTLSLGVGGFVKTQTLRAWDKEGFEAILGKL